MGFNSGFKGLSNKYDANFVGAVYKEPYGIYKSNKCLGHYTISRDQLGPRTCHVAERSHHILFAQSVVLAHMNTRRINGIPLTKLVASVVLPQIDYVQWRTKTKFQVDVN